jgi:hypothetical protein
MTTETASGCPETTFVTAWRGCRETSLKDLLRLRTAYAVRSRLPHPTTVRAIALDAFSAAAECSSSSSNCVVRDQILATCASFCMGVGDVSSCPQYSSSFLAELERSLISAYSFRSSARSHKRAVLRSITHCLVGITEDLTPCTGLDRGDTATLSGILRAWTAILGIIASEGIMSSSDAPDDSSSSASEVVKRVMLKVEGACLAPLGYSFDSPMTCDGIGIKESALRSHSKGLPPPPQGTASSSADSCARTDLGDGSTTIGDLRWRIITFKISRPECQVQCHRRLPLRPVALWHADAQH